MSGTHDHNVKCLEINYFFQNYTPPPFPSNKKIAQAVTVLTCLLRKYPVRATAGANAIILLLLLLLLLLLTAIGLSPGGRV